LTYTSLPQLLHYEDRNSMAFSVESRVPFLVPPLAKFILGLPGHYIVASNGMTKTVFRHAMRGIVPDAILDRTDKLGFPTPEKDWLLSIRPYVERTLESRQASETNALNITRVKQQWAEIISGSMKLDFRVWRWVNLVLWAEKFRAEIA
jgi:asparagine synthase (glutamine-hydrolysing)